MHRARLLLPFAATLALGGAAAGAALAAPAKTPTTTITVTATEFHFKLSKTSVKHGTRVVFKVVDKGQVAHDFAIDKKKSKLIGHGTSTTLSVLFTKKGSFRYICTVPGHAAAGM